MRIGVWYVAFRVRVQLIFSAKRKIQLTNHKIRNSLNTLNFELRLFMVYGCIKRLFRGRLD